MRSPAKFFGALVVLNCLSFAAWADATPPLPTALQTVAYADDQGNYSIKLGGWSGFAAFKPPYNLQTPTLRLADDSTVPACGNTVLSRCFQLKIEDDLLTIQLRGVSPADGAPVLTFHTIANGGSDVVVPVKVLLSRFGPNAPRVGAALATIILLGVVGWVIGMRAPVHLTSGQNVNQLQALFINKATSSYSISNLQLYFWMIAAISTYLYLLIAHIMVQGDWSFVNVPQSVVGVAAISVSTSVLSSGVSSANGGGGSGKFGPNLTDLISSGADIAPERVQQLLWTLLGAPVFIILAYHTDPASISGIQDVPDYFLQLMGVSSAGYLGGKIARGPGPKIVNVGASFDGGPPAFLTLVVTGSDIQTKGASYYLTNLKIPGAAPVALPQNLTPTSKIDSSGVATELDLKLPLPLLTPPAGGGAWNMQFTVRTADGEMAEWQF